MHRWRQSVPLDPAHPGRALQERYVRMVRVLLLALLAVLTLVIGLTFAIVGPGSLSFQGLLYLLGLAVMVMVALARLRVGRLGESVGLVVLGALLVLAAETAETGIIGSSTFLFAYSVPIAFAGLLLGRAALVATAVASVAIVLGVHLLERAGVPWVAFDPAAGDPATIVIVFTLVIVLLALVLERFGVELLAVHRTALRRQHALEREIEERKRAEFDRDRSEERLSLASEAAGMGTWSWDMASGELNWSPSMRKLLGMPPDQPPTFEAFLKRVHPEDRVLVEEAISRAGETLEGGELTYRLLLEEGNIIWVAARFKAFSEDGGDRRQLVGVLYEVTQRKLEERERESLLESERLARAAAENASAKLSFLAEASHLLAASLDSEETLRQLTSLLVPRWADWCVVDLLDDQGRSNRLVVAHQDPQKVEMALELQERYPPRPGAPGAASAIRDGEVQYLAEISEEALAAAAQDEEHLRLLREVGLASLVSVPLVARDKILGAVTLVNSESDRHFTEEDVLFFEQIAGRAAVAVEQSRLFDEVRDLNQELEQRVEQRTKELSEALGELETFAYSVSHDLRAPLRGIDGFSQAMMEDYADKLDGEAVQYLERIRSGARRMGELIDDLLKLSRLSQGMLSVQEVDLSDLAEQVVAALRAREPAREVSVEVLRGLMVRGDRRLLRVALENLIANAWKFTREVAGARIEVGAIDRQGETVYYVRDNGIGFDMNYYDKLFTPFQRLHTAQEFDGSGIGLATVQRVVRRHGGRIWAEGALGQGATFYFTVGS